MSLEISARATKYAEELAGALELDKSSGVGSIDKARAEEIFGGQLPEGVDLKTVKAVQEAGIDFAVGQAKAMADASLNLMKAEKSLERTSLRTTVGFQRFDTTYQKERSGVAMGKPWQKFGTVTSDVVLGVGSKKRDLNRVIEYSASAAEAVFKS